MGTNAYKDTKRGLLAVITSGTSEIKTGAGEYGDETVADSLFPKTINDAMLDDRAYARMATDAAKKKDLDAQKLALAPPDLTDKLFAQARMKQAFGLRTGDRGASFGQG